MKRIPILLFAISLLTLCGCIEAVQSFEKLPPGPWRGQLILESQNFVQEADDEEVQNRVEKLSDKNLPFNFEVSYDKFNNLAFTFLNGKERIPIYHVDFGRDKKLAKDSVRVYFDDYDSYISAYYENNALEGTFVKTNRKNYKIPFKAIYGQKHRFTTLKTKPKTDLTGSWDVIFNEGSEDSYIAVGEFQQRNNHLEGTFLTETGDYRFLEGTVQGNKAFLSVFDGSHAFLFSMKILDDNNLIGSFRSGHTYQSTWSAKRNKNAALRDPTTLTTVDPNNKTIQAVLKSTDGQIIDLSTRTTKPKIVTIMGSWCPNCKDELYYLKEIYNKYKQDLDIYAISYELADDPNKGMEALTKYKEGMNIPFTMLYGGKASKKAVAADFPQLSQFMSYPTLLILNAANEVEYIHTGFNGPATSKYAAFKVSFEQELQKILNLKN